MTIQEFKANLMTKYPSFKGPDSGEMSDIADFLSQYSEGSIGILWFNFRDDYDKGMIPRRSYFYKLADKLNLQRTTKSESCKYEQICYVCASRTNEYRFSFELTTCPRCGNSERPRLSLCRVGQYVDRAKAQQILDGFPPGPWNPALGSHHNKIQATGDFLPANMR